MEEDYLNNLTEKDFFIFPDTTYYLPTLFHADEPLVYDILELAKYYTKINHYKKCIMYGNLAMQWNNGRIIPGQRFEDEYNIPQDKILLILQYFQELKNLRVKGINLVFTAEKPDLDNPLGNFLLEVLNSFDNKFEGQVTLQSDKLYTYIRSNFPNIKLTASLLKPTYEIEAKDRNSDYYNKLLDKYDLVVLHPDDNYKYNLIDKLSDVSRVEVLINEKCPIDCKARKQHYKIITNLYESNTEDIYDTQYLKAKLEHDEFFETVCPKKQSEAKNKHAIPSALTIEDMTELYNRGIKHWKLEGRDASRIMPILKPYLISNRNISFAFGG